MLSKIMVEHSPGHLVEVDVVAMFNDDCSAFIVDDHCYLLVNFTGIVTPLYNFFKSSSGELSRIFKPSFHIFPEALEILKTLPAPE